MSRFVGSVAFGEPKAARGDNDNSDNQPKDGHADNGKRISPNDPKPTLRLTPAARGRIVG